MDNPELSVRRCNACYETKSVSEFHRLKTGKEGRMAQCKSCRKVIQAGRYTAKWFVYTCRLKKAYCKKHGIMFDLTPAYLQEIYTDSCPVFGVLFEHGKTKSNSPTLDRIDPSKGYIQGNVCYISARANRIKYDATVEELKQVLEYYESATTIPRGSRGKCLEAVDPLIRVMI